MCAFSRMYRNGKGPTHRWARGDRRGTRTRGDAAFDSCRRPRRGSGTVMLIPLVDLKLQHRQIADELQQGFARLFENTAFILREEVASFERAFAQFSGVKHCVGVANGTDALEMILRAVGVANGDEVIVPANSFVATAFAVMRAGALPRFVDSDPETHLIDVQAVALQINHRTKAIPALPPHRHMAPKKEPKAPADETGVAFIRQRPQ